MIEYFNQVRAEMQHVAWPTRRQTIMLTLTVVIVSIGVALYLGFADYILQMGLEKIINH